MVSRQCVVKLKRDLIDSEIEKLIRLKLREHFTVPLTKKISLDIFYPLFQSSNVKKNLTILPMKQ